MYLILSRKNITPYYLNEFPVYEFHIARELRTKYLVEDELFMSNGNLVFANFGLVRSFVHKLNTKRDISNHVRIGEVNAAGLIDEIYHFILREYEKNENPHVFHRAFDFLQEKIGEENLRKLLFDFIEVFPPVEVYKGKATAYDYLNSFTGDRSNIEITIEEILLLYFANFNPANTRLRELFDDSYIREKASYLKLINELEKFFQNEKSFGPDNQDIFNLLKTPIINSPNNLWDQLEFIQNKWGVIIKDLLLNRILTSKDLMKEDSKFDTFFGGGGAPPSVTPVYKGKVFGAENLVLGKSLYKYAEDVQKDYEELENFTPDIHWMPQVVMIAKNSYVWLDQLSKKYKCEIKRLDQVPDEELDQFARWNFNALWLIGVWERSAASKKIKHIMGNIDAVASAYSLFDYTIAHDLGGEEAFNDLNERCKARGIRLASDMVPNHTGIYSRWILEHPDYFIQSPKSPFPNYKFTGDDLSNDPNIELKIEDGYWRRSDAGVVFRRIDKRSNDTKYIYHGNDGTNMPWNDTAQLDMLKSEVREAVIQKIFDVARKFSVIRFDAAMTLTKRHFSRLWYPQPGTGGDIPSRSDYALTRQQFGELFPEEFWREVVDRINTEMPETLLLAEAFWLMEGYFVRSLGMHRVYNSAFMHMFMKEENEKYRDLITNTLEFEPEILKRYVNFMSNPDEETAIKQFGTDNKYFGVLTMMLTLPGLPMFAHGQIEGFTEKYGMEYQRAYYNEEPKQWLVERHERQSFPLMRKRYLFAEVNNFWFYDCIDSSGKINENVFAFTNKYGNEKTLVLYNNRYERSTGKIFRSTPKLVAYRENKYLQTTTILDQIGIKCEANFFYIVYNQITQQQYLWKGNDLSNGFEIYMEGFQHHVFFGFDEVYDSTGEYEKLYQHLMGKSINNVQLALVETRLEPIHKAFVNIFNEDDIDHLVDKLITDIDGNGKLQDEIKIVSNKFYFLLNQIKEQFKTTDNFSEIKEKFDLELAVVKNLNSVLKTNFMIDDNIRNASILKIIQLSEKANYKENFILYLLILVLQNMNLIFKKEFNFFNELLISKPVNDTLRILGRGEEGVQREFSLINILLEFLNQFSEENMDRKIDKIDLEKSLTHIFSKMLEDEFTKSFLLVNYYNDVWYFSKERFEELVDWITSLSLIFHIKTHFSNMNILEEVVQDVIIQISKANLTLKEASRKSGYKFDVLTTSLITDVKEN